MAGIGMLTTTTKYHAYHVLSISLITLTACRAAEGRSLMLANATTLLVVVGSKEIDGKSTKYNHIIVFLKQLRWNVIHDDQWSIVFD